MNESNESFSNNYSFLGSLGEISGRDCRQACEIKETVPKRNAVSVENLQACLKGIRNRLLQVYNISSKIQISEIYSL